MKLSRETTAILAPLKKYLSPRLSEIYFALVYAAVSRITVTDAGRLLAGQVILQFGQQHKSLGVPRSTLYWGLKRLEEIGLIHLNRTPEHALVTILNLDRPATAPDLVQAPPPPPTKQKAPALAKNFTDEAPAMRLSKTLFQYIQLRQPNTKEPNLQVWAKEADFLLRLDKRPYEEADKVLRWSQKDTFWSGAILSIANLRKHYDRLRLQMENHHDTPHPNSQAPGQRAYIPFPSAAERKHERLKAAIERFT